MHWFGIPGKVKLVHTIKQFGCITCPRLSLKRYIVGNMVYGPCLLAPLWIPWSSSGFHWCVKETSTRKYRHCVVVVTWATRTVRALQGSHNALYWVRTLLTLSYVFNQYEKQNIIQGKQYNKHLASSLIFCKAKSSLMHFGLPFISCSLHITNLTILITLQR